MSHFKTSQLLTGAVVAISILAIPSIAKADFQWTVVAHMTADDMPPVNFVGQTDKIKNDEQLCIEKAKRIIEEDWGDDQNTKAKARCVRADAIVLPDMEEDLSEATPTSITFIGNHASIKTAASVKACESEAEELGEMMNVLIWCGVTPQQIIREGA